MKKILIIFLSLLVSSCVYPPEQGQPSENPRALGMRYLVGRGVTQDDTKAFEYLSMAAKEDDPFAQNEVAYLYATGRGTEQNYNKAFEYYQKAANHGLASAQYNLGLLYEKGSGTAPDQAAACHLFQQSADHGFEPAKRALGHCHAPSP